MVRGGPCGRDVLGIERREVGEVSPRAVEVETIPDDEDVGYVEAHELRLDAHLGTPVLSQEHEGSHARGAAAAQFQHERLERAPGVEEPDLTSSATK